MIKRPGTWLAIIFVLMALVGGYLYVQQKNTPLYAEEIVFSSAEQLRPDLKSFLNGVESNVKRIKSDVAQTNVDELPVDSLNLYFSELTKKNAPLYGMVIFGSKVNYVILKKENSWVYTYNNMHDSIINWQRIDKNLKPIPNANWTDTYINFMDERNFGSVRVALQNENNFIWRAANSTLPDRQDMVFGIFTLNPDDVDVAALIYKISEMNNRFSGIFQYDHPLVSLFTDDGHMVSPIRTTDTARISLYRKIEEKVGLNYAFWKKKYNEDPQTISFDESDKIYYSRFDTITPALGVKGFALTISEEDLYDAKNDVEQAYVYAAILFLLIALSFYLNTYNKLKKGTSRPDDELEPFTNDEIKQIIDGGETEHVEFKSSLRWDYKEEKVNRVLEDVIMKSIAAFANAKGGTLLIGVSDDLEILGLEHDFKTLKKQDADYFELHLRKMINNQYGIKFSNKYLLMQLQKMEGKTICVIRILPSKYALFLKTKDKQGQLVEKFYVRSGNASQEITSLKEINEYIESRF